ncbi:hypothetical protein DIPPA_27524 [Diplonema papillatum]|nr:hypothetical protein DIPPA_27524 [Diplonema papillatum]
MCEVLTACGECLWDASRVESHVVGLECLWCLDTSTCVPNGTEVGCEDIVMTDSSRFDCPELQCHLAPISFNVYICDPMVMAGFWLNIIILVFCIAYCFWAKTIGERPWALQGLMNLAKHHWASTVEDPADIDTQERTSFENTVDRFDQTVDSLATDRVFAINLDRCSDCTDKQECGWCTVVRVAFLPVLLSATTCVSTIIATLLFSLKTTFFIPYTLITSAIAVLSFVAFASYVRRVGQSGLSWDPYYLRLAWILRGRHISAVFKEQGAGADVEEEVFEGKGAIRSLPQFPSFFGDLYDKVSSPRGGPKGAKVERGVSPMPPAGADADADDGKNRSNSDAAAAGADDPGRSADHSAGAKDSDGRNNNDSSGANTTTGSNSRGASNNHTSQANISSGTRSQSAEIRKSPSRPRATSSDSIDPVDLEDSFASPFPRLPRSASEQAETEIGSLWNRDRENIVAQVVQTMVQINDLIPILAESLDDPLIERVRGLDDKFRNKLQAILTDNTLGEEHEEELIVWCHKPPVLHVLLQEMTFLHSTATAVVVAILFFLSASDEDLSFQNIVGAGNLYAIGAIILTSSLVIIALFFVSSDKVYVLTTHNVITMCNGLSDVHVIVEPNIDVTCGMVCTYTEFGVTQAAFSWRQPRGANRRMAAPISSEFTCLTETAVEQLVNKVKKFCPPLNGKVWDGWKAELLSEWRLHMALTYGALLLSVTTFHYQTVPADILLLWTLCCASFCIAVFARGMRHHLSTYEFFDAKQKRSKWQKPRWRTKRVEQRRASHRPGTEALLDSLAQKRMESARSVDTPGNPLLPLETVY